ncbi:transcriptional regulator [Clostridium sp. chh4-2]|uniref:LacI family DNA-binding transcriptional regulator n=1 Tax=Clostridium sp. chh4-2 TaxID=2067550 RepID=UPI000CCEF756|nr:LacI family DNA-binding transcriptional regulator [Clostridium sp. chh4-2]PNV63614.1 transcriptional regulator [Clostridium sp. chh4-2]
MVSIKDVARHAKVAPSTVSLVLNKTGYVSAETREKVERSMKELNYTPNELARNLYRNKTNIVGIIVPDMSHPFFSTFIQYAEMCLYDHGYKTMVCSTTNRKNGEEECIDMLKRQMMDGIIMGAHSLRLDIYENLNRPVVALDRYINDDIPIVRSDHKKEGELAADRLLKAGCKKVVQSSGARIVSTPSHERHDAFHSYFESHGGTVYDMEMGWNHFDLAYNLEFAERIFREHPDADGIFAADMLIASCLQYAHHQGIQVPEQMRMIACDGTILTMGVERPVTAVVQPIEDLACAAVENVVKLIDGSRMTKSETVFDVTLREGETT